MIDLERLRPGQSLPPFVVGEIDRDRIVSIMEIMADTNPIHEDVDVARRLGFRGLVNQGPANMSYVANMLVAWAGDPRTIRALEFRFLDNVVPGDRLTARGEVTDVAPGDDGTAIGCRFELEADDGGVRLTGHARLVVPHA